jgi:hypothetical protein
VSTYTDLEPYLTDAEKAELARLIASDTRLFLPTPGPQMMAATSEADIVGYGGAAGGGKTMLISGLALTEHKRSAIFRQHKNQTQKFVQDFGLILGDSSGYSSQNSQWRYDGRLVEFGGLEDPVDHQKWQGRDHDLKAYDEATQMREFDVRYTMGWCRSADPDQRCRIVLTFNPPTTAEGRWVIRFFAPWLDPAHPNPAKDGDLRWFTTLDGNEDFEVPDGRPFVRVPDNAEGERVYEFDAKAVRPENIYRPMSRTFITARVSDNPYYMATGYVKQLQNLPEPLRSQMLHGDFMAGVEDDARQLIPTSWIEASFERYRQLIAKADFRLGPMDSLGVDAARGGNMGGTTGMGGKDKMVISPRHGLVFPPQVVIPGVDVNTGNLAAAQVIARRRDDAPVHLDIIGVGTSVGDSLAENHVHVVQVNGTAKSFGMDRSNLLRFFNKRAEIHWRMREALDPANPDAIALAPDPELLADLAAPTWSLTPTGIKIESKDEIKARIHRSPDKGESAMYANIQTPKRKMGIVGYAGVALNDTASYEEKRLQELT